MKFGIPGIFLGLFGNKLEYPFGSGGSVYLPADGGGCDEGSSVRR